MKYGFKFLDIFSSAVMFMLFFSSINLSASFLDDVKKDTEWLASYESRVPGTVGHDEVSEKLFTTIKQIPNISVWEDPFKLTVPAVKKAELTIMGVINSKYKIYPVWPDVVRMKDTPKAGISGKLIYVGKGRITDIPAKSLQGQIAVMEMSSYKNWKNAFNMGAKAILLLGGNKDEAIQPTAQPLFMPRYYLPECALSDKLRSKKNVFSANLFCRGEWKTTKARNIYALVKPAETESNPLSPLVITVPYDSMSVIMGLAPGAENAVNTAVALNLLKFLSDNPPKRAVLFGFIDAYSINQMGIRKMFSMLSVNKNDQTRQVYEVEILEQIEEYKILCIDVDIVKYSRNDADTEVINQYWNLKREKDHLSIVERSALLSEDKEMVQKYKVACAAFDKAAAAYNTLVAGGTKPNALDQLYQKNRYRELQRCFKDYFSPAIFGDRAERGEIKTEQRHLKSDLFSIFEKTDEKGKTISEMNHPIRLRTKKIFIELSDRMLYLDKRVVTNEPLFNEKITNEWNELIKLYTNDLGLKNAKEIFYKLQRTYLAVEKKQISLKFNNRILKAILYKNTKLLGEQKLEAEKAWGAIQKRIFIQYQMACRRYDSWLKLDEFRGRIYKELGEKDIQAKIFNYVIGIDLSDSGTTVGPATLATFLYSIETDIIRPFVDWLKIRLRTVKNGASSYNSGMLSVLELQKKSADRILTTCVNRVSFDGSCDPLAQNLALTGVITSPTRSFNMEGATLATLECLRPKLDTPNDTFLALNWKRLEPQIKTIALILTDMVNDPNFNYHYLPHAGFPAWRNPHGSVVMESVSETVPRTPMVGFLTTLIDGSKNSPGRAATRGIRSNEFTYTGPDGRFVFDFFPAVRDGWKRKRSVFAVDFNYDGEIVKALSDSTSMVSGKLANEVDLQAPPPLSPMRVIAFDCRELTGPLMFDTRFQIPLSQFQLFDVVKGGKPNRYYMSIHNGQMYGLLPPDTRWQLIMRLGTAKRRMALMNISKYILDDNLSISDAIKRGGFNVNKPFDKIPSLVSAKDFYAIDEWRINALKSAGISCAPIEKIHAQTAEYLKASKIALENNDGAALMRAADSAMATEIRAYHAVQDQADDVSRGAIFLLLLLLPFAVAMERIIFNCVRIGAQIMSTSGIFIFMGILLYSFHPAFRITAQPVIILMAFLIIFLSALVISLILRKFEAELEEIRRGSMAESSGAQTNRSGLIGSAIWLGLANMRKRRLRTTLTALTIVLITFAVLCFTSSNTYQDKRIFTLDVHADIPCVVIQHPTMKPFDLSALDNISNFIENQYPVSPRYWITNINASWKLFARKPNTDKYITLKAGLGLSVNEPLVTNIKGVLNNWEEFSKGSGCYLSNHNAEALGVKPGDTIILAGQNLTLIDTFDDIELEKRLKNIDGHSLLPYDYTVSKDSQMTQEQTEAQLTTGDIMSFSDNYQYVTGDDVIIVPEDIASDMKATMRSIAFAVPEEKSKKVAEDVMNLLAYPIYYSTTKDVKVIISTPIIPQAPRNLAIPLIIAALIIFNTMLNSVAERKREIHIYTSLGLAPKHVGMLFLAEAATYGLMGSVFGYIVGQAIAKVLTGLGLMGGITLNYSGTNVIMTMGMVIAVVLLSSIVPAIMAGKVASPSSDLNWKVPKPVDGVILDQLPFTVTVQAARGLVSFIYEYIEAHQEGSIGHFTSDETLELLSEKGDRIVGIKGTVWLEPYDLGVRQKFIIEIVKDIEDICKIKIKIIHAAGQERSWWRLNRVFMSDIRRQLLGWRNIAPERVMKYIKDAENKK